MKCPQCSSDIGDDSKFCKECGASISTADQAQPSFTKTMETPVEELTTGSRFADRYQIIEELGKGGMGRVYRALDQELNEEVALKLIRPEIAADEKTVDRFKRELKLARKIVHENVGRVYELMDDEGTLFISMEYIPGEDLKSFIHRSGRLSIPKALDIAMQICAGLSAAHRIGVVHRDLKPSNILIDKEGNARIMDFGIARTSQGKGITGEGIMVGTPDYMSPEQAQAKGVDMLSDIYSLGVILYEMATGQLPFEGDTALSLAMKHQSEIPKDPREINAQIPDELSRVILRCLEKDKKKRFQGSEELLSTLSHFETGKISEERWKNSIAVLPFTNMSADPEQEYFCDGISEEIINALSHIESLRVIARTSAFAFKGKHEDVRKIGRKLDVDTLLAGSVRKVGERIRITAQLINVADGSHLWSERYDRNMKDFFTIQDDISLAIVDNLKMKLLGKEKTRLLKRYTDDLEAYNLYLKGNHFTAMLTAEGSKKAMQYYEQSLRNDPNHALTYYGMSSLYMAGAFWANVPPHEAYPKMKEYAEKALEIDDTLGLAHSLLGCFYTHYEWNWQEAERELVQALKLNQSVAMIHEYYYFFLTINGRHEKAIAEAKLAQKLDPLSRFINTHVGHAFFNAGLYDKAIEELQSTLMANPDYHLAHYVLGMAYLGKSMLEEAILEFERSVDMSGGAPWEVMNLACAYYDSGTKVQAEKLFDSLKELSRHKYVPPMCFFYYHLIEGDQDQAYEWLKTACQEHDSWLPWCRVNPLECYRISDEPRFNALLESAGLK